jgi:hypothetical protein
VCRRCNPADLPAPSPSQYHAFVFLSVIAAVIVMTVLVMVR